MTATHRAFATEVAKAFHSEEDRAFTAVQVGS